MKVVCGISGVSLLCISSLRQRQRYVAPSVGSFETQTSPEEKKMPLDEAALCQAMTGRENELTDDHQNVAHFGLVGTRRSHL